MVRKSSSAFWNVSQELTVHGPEFVRQICEPLSAESDDRCNELISILRTALEEDREELGCA